MSETSSSTVPPWQTPEGIASLHNFEVTTLPLSLTLQMDASPLVKERRDLNPHNFKRGSRSIARRVGRGPVKGAACARITLGCAWNVVTPSFCLGETFGYPNHLPILAPLLTLAPASIATVQIVVIRKGPWPLPPSSLLKVTATPSTSLLRCGAAVAPPAAPRQS